MKLEGKKTIVTYNSAGFPYAMDTRIVEVQEDRNKIVIIHKPKRKQKHYRHTYTKDSELKIYEGWLNLGDLMDNVTTSYEPTRKLDSIKSKPIYIF